MIPKLLREKKGMGVNIDFVHGFDFPENLEHYDLVIQCGGCMLSRNLILSRIEKAKKRGVPLTNYGMVIAYLNGILDKIALPGSNL